MLRRVSKIGNGSGEKWSWINKSATALLFGKSELIVLFHGCAAAIFTVLFLLNGLCCAQASFKTAEIWIWNICPLLAPDSCLCRVSPKLRLILGKIALSVCTTGAERLLQLNFMLSRTSDMFLLKTQTIKSSAFSSFSLSVLSAPFRLSLQRSAALIRLLEWRD